MAWLGMAGRAMTWLGMGRAWLEMAAQSMPARACAMLHTSTTSCMLPWPHLRSCGQSRWSPQSQSPPAPCLLRTGCRSSQLPGPARRRRHGNLHGRPCVRSKALPCWATEKRCHGAPCPFRFGFVPCMLRPSLGVLACVAHCRAAAGSPPHARQACRRPPARQGSVRAQHGSGQLHAAGTWQHGGTAQCVPGSREAFDYSSRHVPTCAAQVATGEAAHGLRHGPRARAAQPYIACRGMPGRHAGRPVKRCIFCGCHAGLIATQSERMHAREERPPASPALAF